MAAVPAVQSSRRHLSEPHPEWALVAPLQKENDLITNHIFSLPINELRAIEFGNSPLPLDAPVPGKDITVAEESVNVRDSTKIRLRIYRPIPEVQRAILFFNTHGGGWVIGDAETEEAQNRFIARKNGAVVVSVDYRRAPEYPHPYAINDCFDALLWCQTNAEFLGIDPNRVIVGGSSAGANISAVLALKARDEGIGGIIGQILNIPATCHPAHFPFDQYENNSYEENKNAPILDAARMRWFWDCYLPNAGPNPSASPLLAPLLRGLPPTLQVAGMDPLRDEGIAYAERLEASDVAVTLKIYAGLPHGFYIHPQLRGSIEYFQTMVDWIQDKFADTNRA